MAKIRCSNCKEYVYRDEAIRFGLASFCSQVCVEEKRTRTRSSSTAKAPGSRKRSHRTEGFPPEIKEAILAADRYKCRACNSKTGHLHCHHIVYRSEGGQHTIDNGVTLCDDCHLYVVHANKKRFQPLLKKLVLLRETGADVGLTVYDLETKDNNED